MQARVAGLPFYMYPQEEYNKDMKHPFLSALIIIGAGIVIWYGLSLPSVTPTLTVVAPASGETWHTGETHTILWSTVGVPTTDKVSVTIRRIPPPPLPTEGQEFDSIVAVNLPNTGSATWTISSMYPDGIYVLGVSAYKSVPVTSPVSGDSAAFTIVHK